MNYVNRLFYAFTIPEENDRLLILNNWVSFNYKILFSLPAKSFSCLCWTVS